MDKSMTFSVCVLLFGVLIACFSQLLLKKAAMRTYDKWYKQYLNWYVILGYCIMLLSTLCSAIAYRVVPLSTGPVWTAAQQLFMLTLCFFCLKERPSKRKLAGLGIIIVGVFVFTFQFA